MNRADLAAITIGALIGAVTGWASAHRFADWLDWETERRRVGYLDEDDE